MPNGDCRASPQLAAGPCPVSTDPRRFRRRGMALARDPSHCQAWRPDFASPPDTIQFRICKLHGHDVLNKPLVSSVGRAALLLENSNQAAAQATLDRTGIERLSPEGHMLMRAVAKRLAISVPAVPVLNRSLNEAPSQTAWMASHFDRFERFAAMFEKVGGVWDPSKHPRWPAGADGGQGGKFTSTAGAGISAWNLGGNPLLSPVDYSDGFHGVVVKAWADAFRAAGVPVVENPAIRFIGPDSSVIGYPDLIIHAPGQGLEAIEVKTGIDPPFSDSQRAYYPLLQLGEHVYSNDPRVAVLGIPPGQPFPPMMVYRIYTPGPGQPYEVHQLPPPRFVP
jgi:hypothetical protein